MILKALKDEGIELSEIDAVSGRGVGLYACAGGTYKIDDLVFEHAKNDVAGIHHPATLGIVISYKLGKQLGIPAFYVNPMPTDELCDEARVTGIPGIYRTARSHPLNQKQVAIHHSEKMGVKYEDSNCHPAFGRWNQHYGTLSWKNDRHQPRWRWSGTDVSEPFR